MDDIAGAAETSKGGIYFHFPTKEAIFRELMQTTADKLVGRVERAVALETEPVARAEAAIRTVLSTFAGHRTMARLLFLDTVGAGRVFQAETNALHDRFAVLIQGYLDDAVAAGAIPPMDTRITSIAWFGAINEVVGRWLLADQAGAARGRLPGPARDAPAERRGAGGADRRGPAAGRGLGLPGGRPMTAVRPMPARRRRQRQPADPGAGLGERLHRLRDDAPGARDGLTAATVAVTGIDPISLYRRRRGGRPRGRALAAPRRGHRVRGRSGGPGPRSPRARPASGLPRPPGATWSATPASTARPATAAARARSSSAPWASPAVSRQRTTCGPRSARARSSCPELLLSVTPGGATVTGSMVGDGPDVPGAAALPIHAPSSVAGTSSRSAPATSPPTRTAWSPGPSSPR